MDHKMETTKHIEALNLNEMLPEGFAPESRVWIFQSSRPFSEKEEREIDEQLYQFYVQWNSHGTPVKGWSKLLFRRFVVVMADERDSGVSGCSTDSMMRVIKSLERQYSVDLFDRLTLTFLVKGQPEPLPMQQVAYALEKGYLTPDTPLFNNLVDTKDKLETEWLVPLRQSWLASRIPALS